MTLEERRRLREHVMNELTIHPDSFHAGIILTLLNALHEAEERVANREAALACAVRQLRDLREEQARHD